MENESRTSSKGGCGKAALWLFGILVGLAGLGAVLGDPPQETDDKGPDRFVDAVEATEDSGEVGTTSSESMSDWTIFERKDELRGTKDRFATVESNNSVQFDFPYCCDSTLEITVRKTEQYGEDVIFQISDGQFVCGVYDCRGMISFDGQPEQLSLKSSADHDPKVLFATFSEAIIKKLKSSEKVIVELPFYQEGNRQFTFNTKGLDWD